MMRLVIIGIQLFCIFFTTMAIGQVSSFSELVKRPQPAERIVRPGDEALETFLHEWKALGGGKIYYDDKPLVLTKEGVYYFDDKYINYLSATTLDMGKFSIAPPTAEDSAFNNKTNSQLRSKAGVAIAISNLVSYRNRSRVAASAGTCESIRGAMAAYAADSVSNLFPNNGANWQNITNWSSLVNVLNGNGASLKKTEAEQGMEFVIYKNWDLNGDGLKGDDYYFIFKTSGVPNTMTGALIEARSSGVTRWSNGL